MTCTRSSTSCWLPRTPSRQYSSKQASELRRQVAERLARDGISCGADDVLIIQGGQQGLDLCAKLVINAGMW